jgi:hypothetical protein
MIKIGAIDCILIGMNTDFLKFLFARQKHSFTYLASHIFMRSYVLKLR